MLIGWSEGYSKGKRSYGVAGKCCRVFSHRRCVIQYRNSDTRFGNLFMSEFKAVCKSGMTVQSRCFGTWHLSMPVCVSTVMWICSARRQGFNTGTVRIAGVPCRWSGQMIFQGYRWNARILLKLANTYSQRLWGKFEIQFWYHSAGTVTECTRCALRDAP